MTSEYNISVAEYRVAGVPVRLIVLKAITRAYNCFKGITRPWVELRFKLVKPEAAVVLIRTVAP